MHGYVDEIINQAELLGGITADNLRIVLNNYDILEKETGLIVAESDARQKALQMFFVAKKVEGCTDKTIQYYSFVLRKFFNEMDCKLEEIGTDQIRYYLAVRSMRDKIGKTSQDNELRVLKSFFKWCTGENYIDKDPTVNIKAVRKEKRIKKPFTEIELEKIRGNAKSKRDAAIIEVLYSTGVRVAELCGMNRQDVNGDEITVFGKGEKERIVYLNAKAQLALAEYLGERADANEALFISARSKKRLCAGGVEAMIRETGHRAGVMKCHPHRFRRTAGTLALNRGMPIEQVQKMLGHENITTTTIYARSEKENVKASHKRYVI